VALGTLVRDTGAVDRLVAFDAAVEGFLQATALLQGLGLVDDSGSAAADAPPGPFRVELFAGSVDDERTEPSFAAAMSVLQPYLDAGTLVVASGETALDQATTLRGNGATAASRLSRILRDFYAASDEAAQSGDRAWPDGILAPSDAIARAAAEVLAAAGAVAGEDFPVLTGRGAELRSVVGLLDGIQYATLLEDPRLLASEAADRVIDALRTGPAGIPEPSAAPPGPAVDNGARQVPASLVQPQSVRADDIDALVIGSGYWTQARLDDAVAEFGQAPIPTPSPTP
jgi:putative multiple sugar transport system substrate-binding protein